ncbi:unnamed protein product [Owenia fusiformis]|uniref:Sulfotransferase n=1 Tax=Owenia fusiformis TaxID=6347 RepID=A0A8S4N7N8_OWEFU|nr:unnamed protein product [Owenia fusiformis]
MYFLDVSIRLLIKWINVIDYYIRALTGVVLFPIDSKRTVLELEALIKERGRQFDFREPCRVQLDCLESDKKINLFGRLAVRNFLGSPAVIRKFLRYVDESPEIRKINITRPIFIVGQMRTGTTFLFNLLAQDESLFSPPFWQISDPTPRELDRNGKDSRIKEAVGNIDLLHIYGPQTQTTHPVDALGPDECELQFMRYFVTRDLPHTVYRNLAPYQRWYRTVDDQTLQNLYQNYKLELQSFIHQAGTQDKTVLRKDSNHASFIRQLLATFPDARVIYTVRDPAEIVPSACSMNESYVELSYFLADIDQKQIGRQVLGHMMHEAECFLAYRKQYDENNQGSSQFMDINYEDFIKAPMATVRCIYEHFGMELSDAAVAKMERYIKESPQYKHGKHIYNAERYGFTVDALRKAFRDYIEYFNVRLT